MKSWLTSGKDLSAGSKYSSMQCYVILSTRVLFREKFGDLPWAGKTSSLFLLALNHGHVCSFSLTGDSRVSMEERTVTIKLINSSVLTSK